MDYGELVAEDSQTVEKLGSSWSVKTYVYYTGRYYNVCAAIKTRKGMFSVTRYSNMDIVNHKEEIDTACEELIDGLFETAADRKEARDLSIDVDIS